MLKTLNTMAIKDGLGRRFANNLAIETIISLGQAIYDRRHSFVTKDDHGTKMLEVVGESASFPEVSTDTFIKISHKMNQLRKFGYEFDLRMMKKFIDCIESGKPYELRSYHTRYYDKGFAKAFKLGLDLTNQETFFSTRQAVIDFGKGVGGNPHCIEKVQFVARELNGSYHLNVITTMRSCNLTSNFLHDMYLIHRLAQLYIKGRNDSNKSDNREFTVHLSFTFGSLHVYL